MLLLLFFFYCTFTVFFPVNNPQIAADSIQIEWVWSVSTAAEFCIINKWKQMSIAIL